MTDIQNIIHWDKKCSTLIPFFVFLLSLQAVKQKKKYINNRIWDYYKKS